MLGYTLVASLGVFSSLLGGVTAGDGASSSHVTSNHGSPNRAYSRPGSPRPGSPRPGSPRPGSPRPGSPNRATTGGSGASSDENPFIPPVVYVGSHLTPPEVLMNNGLYSSGAGHIDPEIPYVGHLWLQSEELDPKDASGLKNDPWITGNVDPAHAWWTFGQKHVKKNSIYYVYYVKTSYIKPQLIEGQEKYSKSLKLFPYPVEEPKKEHFPVFPLFDSHIPWEAITAWDMVEPDGSGKREDNKARLMKPDWRAWNMPAHV
ncbi:hypothetical protein PspLS_02526 [Pyricularia sp. CBS 133598]|nr:hypothetical protein PspLS_02526 [Pyricularia sp. CBS 133598]